MATSRRAMSSLQQRKQVKGKFTAVGYRTTSTQSMCYALLAAGFPEIKFVGVVLVIKTDHDTWIRFNLNEPVRLN